MQKIDGRHCREEHAYIPRVGVVLMFSSVVTFTHVFVPVRFESFLDDDDMVLIELDFF